MQSLQRRLKEDGYQQLRSGLMSVLSLLERSQSISTALESTALQVATPANHSRKRVANLAKTMRDIYGRTSLARLSAMHQRCVSSRMSAGTLFADFQRSANIWKDWVTGLRQVSLQRLKSVQDTSENVSSSWPTAGANDHKGSSQPGQRRGQLDEAAEQMWATPNVPNRGMELTKPRKASGGIDLQSQAFLHAQRSRECESTHTTEHHCSHSGPPAPSQTTGTTSHTSGTSSCQLWPTPTANDDNKSPEAHLAMKSRMPGGTRKAITSLNVLTKIRATPAATNATNTRNRTSRTNRGGNDGETLCDQVHPKRLNPAFVEWLMGYLEPISSEHSEIRSSHILQRWLSSVCGQH